MPRPAAAQCAADVFPDVPDGVVDVFDLLVLLSCHTPPCDGDINGDGALDSVDLALLLFHWGPCSSATDPCPADVDGSGAVGIEDFLIVLAAWG